MPLLHILCLCYKYTYFSQAASYYSEYFIAMEPAKLDNYHNFQNFIKLQQEIIDSCTIRTTKCTTVFDLEELFRFYNEHFKEFHQKENLRVVLAFTHRCLKEWINRGNYLKEDIGVHLTSFIQDNCKHDSDRNIVIQIVYQVMYSIKLLGNKDVPISEELLQQLLSILPLNKNRGSASNCMACIHKYIELFPESCKNLASLWSYLKDQLEIKLRTGVTYEIEIDILLQFVDEFKSLQSNFHDEPIIIIVIQHLLKSDQRKFRKCAYYLLKKLSCYFIENVSTVSKMWMSSHHNQKIDQSWVIYITMLENLEEEQSHLILPSLGNIKELIKNKYLHPTWLNILYMRILTHNNNLVLRWSIEFFLRTFSCSDLCEDTLKHLLQATNSNSFFNYEGYFLNTNYFSTFLKGDVIILLRLLSEIENWSSVPLYIWLENLNKTQCAKSITFEDILKIASCVRRLQNCTIRGKALIKLQELFVDFIKEMSMEQYVTYIETAYNPGDIYLDHDIFFSKKSSLFQPIYKQRFYEIFTNSEWDNNDLLSFLEYIPVEKHGWLKFALFKYAIDKSDYNSIRNLYKLDLNGLRYINIHEVINIFKNSLLCSPPYDRQETTECKKAAIAFYIYEKEIFDIEDEDTLRFIINTGMSHNRLVDIFAQKLLNNTAEKIDLWFIDELLKYNSYEMLQCVSEYLCSVFDEDIIKKYAIIILKICSFKYNLFEGTNLLKNITDEWLESLPSQGDKRIEEAFTFNHFSLTNRFLSKYCLKQIRNYHDETYVLDLLKYHMDITKKKPRYFENSNEHRVKLRVAICVYKASYKLTSINVLDQIWNILLNENNQLNVIYIYEFTLGIREFREDVILEKLKQAQNLTSRQQVSIISVAYTYFQTKSLTYEVKSTVVYILLSLTMGPNFQTRLLAQMCLYQLLMDKFKEIENGAQIIQSIKDATGTKLNEYLSDIRLHMRQKFGNTNAILYVTNAPFDELVHYINWSIHSETKEFMRIERCRERYLNKFKVTKDCDTSFTGTINDHIQRKINPINDITEPHNLIAYPIEKNSAGMIVVASLIDKLPNLGGIARTCEVLGINNLVMDSKMLTEKNDFKNLSMTAEKTLNIVEVKPRDLKDFLIQKKLDGYSIVGAEQTCRSENFKNFKFPQKCVLLLGHEKDGIPAPLLGLLDNAVEIPQLGQVRSLNVHVTGALFMWEYCKQHLIQKL